MRLPWRRIPNLRPPSLRPRGADDLGLRRALRPTTLPLLVAAMAFLAALALGGVAGADALARHWRVDAAALVTVQLPNPSQARLAPVLALLAAEPAIAAARALDEEEMASLLRPWLGKEAERIALPLPALIEIRLHPGAQLPPSLPARLEAAAPGTLLDDHGPWLRRLAALARSLWASALAVLGLVAGLAAGVIGHITHAGLLARRGAIETLHGLGATDGDIAGRFARRVTWLTFLGGLLGTIAALPVLAMLADRASPITELGAASPPPIWFLFPALAPATALIGWLVTQLTVRRWLRRLP